MERRTPIFTALDPQMLSSGLAPDLHSTMTPLWVCGTGVEFVDGKVKHRKSRLKLLGIDTAPVRGLGAQTLSNGETALWVVHGTALYRWDQFSLRLVKNYPAGVASKPYFAFLPYGDFLFVNRGFGVIDFWNGNSFGVIPEMPENCGRLIKHLSFLLALGVGSKGTGVSWSDANDISQWTPTRTNTAGAVYIDEFQSGIIGGTQLGPVIAVYSDNQMAIVSFIGSPFYFGQKVLLTGIGLVGPEALVAAGNLNYGISRQGIWMTDGNDYKYIDQGRLNTYLQDNVNWSAATRCIAVRNDILRTVEFYFPMGTSVELTEGWSYDPRTQAFTELPPIAFYDESLALALPVVADHSGAVLLESGQNFSTADLLLCSKPLLMQVQSQSGLTDVHFVSKVDGIELFLHDVQNCRMRIGSSMEYNGTINWSPYIELSADKSTYDVPAGQPDGVYWFLEFSNDSPGVAVVEDGEVVLEAGEDVVAVDLASSWKFNLQGFLLYGTIHGGKQ